MTTKQRIEKLEKAKQEDGALNRYKYFCLVDETESQAEGYRVQCLSRENGGTGGDPLHFAARADLDNFAARADVELTLVRLVNDEPARNVEP